MSPLFSFFLCSHYMPFPLFIVNLLFFHFDHPSHCPHLIFLSYSPLPPIFSTFLSPLSFLLSLSHPPPLSFHIPMFPSCPIPPFLLLSLSPLPLSFGHYHLSLLLFFFPPLVSLHPSYSTSTPLQGVGGDDGRGTEHTDPPQ